MMISRPSWGRSALLSVRLALTACKETVDKLTAPASVTGSVERKEQALLPDGDQPGVYRLVEVRVPLEDVLVHWTQVEAKLEPAQIALEYTRVMAPIDRRSSLMSVVPRLHCELSDVTLSTGLPSLLLIRYPDLIAVEPVLTADSVNVDPAQATSFANFSLTASSGVANDQHQAMDGKGE